MFYVIQAGSKLYTVDTSGTATELTLPSGVTIDSTKKGRFAVLGRNILFTYAPDVNLWIDPDGSTVRPMVPRPPASQLILAAGTSTGLTGAYKAKQQFLIKDAGGLVLARSAYGPPSNSFTAANQSLGASGTAISQDAAVNASRFSRTVAGGAVYFEWLDLDGNDVTSFDDALSDASLGLLPEEDADNPQMSPPGTFPGSGGLDLLVTWKDRLWAKSTVEPDYLLYTEERAFWDWRVGNKIPAKPVGADFTGLTAIMPRRDELVLGKKNRLSKIVGSSNDDFEEIVIMEGQSCYAQGIVIRDTCYFIGADGFYSYGSNGLESLSDTKAGDWFRSDTYFNRTVFNTALIGWDPVLACIRILLPSAGQTTLDRWIDYYPDTKRWLGPHKTAGFTPSSIFLFDDSTDRPLPVLGATDGKIYQANQSTFHDAASSAIDLTFTTLHNENTPALVKHWGQLILYSKIQAAGSMTITPTLGKLNAAAASVTSITRSGTTATLTTPAAHGFVAGNFVYVAGATQTQYNGLKEVLTVPSTTTLTYTVSGSPATPATGTITIAPGSFAPITADMTKGHEDLRYLGDGEILQLQFTHDTADQDAEVYGYEIDGIRKLYRP